MSVDEDARLLTIATWPFQMSSAPKSIGLAVSGGSDSLALLWLLAPWAMAAGIKVAVATVDHGLRPEARTEAQFVAGCCSIIEVPHQTLEWRDWDGRGNTQAAARAARQRLLAGWAKTQQLDAVVLGHTLDDQAETVLLRLARGSGVDGLSAMANDRSHGGMRWMRPLLNLRRADLRDYLGRHGRIWVDDPSNDDMTYDRVKMRKALTVLEPLGIDADRLADTALKLSMASKALARYAQDAAAQHITVRSGDVVLPKAALLSLPYETQLRLVAAAICWVTGSDYRPRLIALQEAWSNALLSRRHTLQGALLYANRSEVIISREYNAVRHIKYGSDTLWDNRWSLDGPHAPGLEIRALGPTGLLLCPNWRATGIPRASLLSSPAVWQGETLIAAPLAGFNDAWQARIVADFHSSLLSH
jgi:tRNA(Ile)-lysidine synthase